MPRSGTSWLSQIVDSSPETRFRLSPIFSYALKNSVNQNSSKEDFERMFNSAYEIEDEFMNQTKRRENGEYPQFFQKSEKPENLVIKMTRFHNLIERMLKLFDNMKMVSIIRHPCGTIHSWLTTPGEFPSNADPEKEWFTGACRKTSVEEFWGFEDWKKVTKLHMKLKSEYPGQFYIIRYENLVENAINESQKLFRFLNLKIEDQTLRFIKESQTKHNRSDYAVYKKPEVRERWIKELQPSIRDAIINDIQSSDLKVFLT